MTEQLKPLPCPFCGGAAHFFKITDLDEKNFGGEGICCGSCPITTDLMFSLMEDCKPKLAEAWNRRQAADFLNNSTASMAQHDRAALEVFAPENCYFNIRPLYAAPPAQQPQAEAVPSDVVRDADVEAAAKKMAEIFDYPWDFMPEKGRNTMRENVRAVLAAAQGAKT